MSCNVFRSTRKNICFSGRGLLCLGLVGASAVGADPLASNNGFYPDPAAYTGPFNIANLDYPAAPPTTHWEPGGGVQGPLSQDTALNYMDALKAYLELTMRALIDAPQTWDSRAAGWYDMVWLGASDGGDPTSGREAIMNTYGGQIVPSDSWSAPYTPTTPWMQNYGVIYYDALAASMLGEVWADVYDADLGKLDFPAGSIVVKAEAATVQPAEWPSPETGSVLADAAEWQVFRPTTEAQKAHQADPSAPLENVVQTIYPFQLAIKVKDPVAAPETGWVYMAYVYDARLEGTPWDRFAPAGAMWGNDPALATRPDGRPESGDLSETWLNPAAPPFFADTLGWGGRLAAPMDVAVRHNVILPSGQRVSGADGFRASSCHSCHGTAEFPFTVNLYPSPNRTFPPDDAPFPMYQPGSDKWAEWFQNRRGNVPQSGNIGGIALDYDLSTMFALGAWASASEQEAFAFERFHVHH